MILTRHSACRMSKDFDQLKNFIRLWRLPETTFGRLVRHDIAWAQFLLGTSKSFLTEVTNSLPHLKDKWYARLRQFLCNIGGSLDLQPSFVPPLERDNDMYIMDLILQNQFFSDEEIRHMNNCVDCTLWLSLWLI